MNCPTCGHDAEAPLFPPITEDMVMSVRDAFRAVYGTDRPSTDEPPAT